MNRPTRRGDVVALALSTMLAAAPAAAQDALPSDRVDLLLLTEQSRGDYGGPTPTRIHNLSLVGRYRGAGWVGEIQLPWLQVHSSGPVGGLPDSAQPGRSTEHGLGDIWLKLGLGLREVDAGSTGVDLTLKLKTASGDAGRGLGSGGTDLAAQLELMRSLGPWVAFGHVGWRHTGDLPGFTPYRNPWYGEIGLSRPLTPTLELGGFVDAREPIGRLGAVGETTAYAAWHQGGQRVQFYLTRGHAPASPDWAAGLSWRTRF